MNAIQSVGVIQETRNYGLFDFVKGNRDINRSHVNRLKDKIKRRDLKEIPILVLSKTKKVSTLSLMGNTDSLQEVN